MKRVIPAVFVIIIAILASIVLYNRYVASNETDPSLKQDAVIMDGNTVSDESGLAEEDTKYISFIELTSEETLLSVVTMDVDGDGYDDQINVCKVANNPYIVLVVGLYNPNSKIYERKAYLATKVTQFQTFACTGMDVLGNHKSALVYQGDTENGHQVLKIYLANKTSSGQLNVRMIGDFETDERVFIQQSERSEAYEMGQAKASPFPVWVYSSVPEENKRLDQIQKMYEWDAEAGKYVETKTVRVSGNKIAQKELEKIQDGTVATFANFLNGLWYKVENQGEMRFVFFDYKNKEVLFQVDNSVEVYSWLQSNLRRNGIYFSSVNKTIENMQRRFEITLVNVDEIKVRITDDVRMLINETNLWNGNYKKFVSSENFAPSKIEPTIVDELKEAAYWTTSDGTRIVFSANEYTVHGADGDSNGKFIPQKVGDTMLIQFRTVSDKTFFSKFVEPKFMQNEVSRTVKGKTVTSLETDRNTVVFQTVVVNPDGYYALETQPLILHRGEVKGDVQ